MFTQADIDARGAQQRAEMQREGGRNAALAGRESAAQLSSGLELADLLAIRLLISLNKTIPYPDPVECPSCKASTDYCDRCHGLGTVPPLPDPGKVKIARAIVYLEKHRRRNVSQSS